MMKNSILCLFLCVFAHGLIAQNTAQHWLPLYGSQDLSPYAEPFMSISPNMRHAVQIGNTMWSYAAKRGLIAIDINSHQWKMYYPGITALPGNEIRAIKALNGRLLCLIGRNTLGVFDGNVWEPIQVPSAYQDHHILDILVEGQANIWLYTLNNGVTEVLKVDDQMVWWSSIHSAPPLLLADHSYCESAGLFSINCHGKQFSLPSTLRSITSGQDQFTAVAVLPQFEISANEVIVKVIYYGDVGSCTWSGTVTVGSSFILNTDSGIWTYAGYVVFGHDDKVWRMLGSDVQQYSNGVFATKHQLSATHVYPILIAVDKQGVAYHIETGSDLVAVAPDGTKHDFGRFRNFDFKFDERQGKVSGLHDGSIALVSNDGFQRISDQSNELITNLPTTKVFSADQKMWVVKANEYSIYPVDNGVLGSLTGVGFPKSYHPGTDQLLYHDFQSRRLYAVQNGVTTLIDATTEPNAPSTALQDVVRISQDSIVTGTFDNTYALRTNNGIWENLIPPVANASNFQPIYGNNALWLYSDSIYLRFNSKGWQLFPRIPELNQYTNMVEETNELSWSGSYRGFSQITPQAETYIECLGAPSFQSNNVHSIAIDAHGNKWIQHPDYGILLYNQNGITIPPQLVETEEIAPETQPDLVIFPNPTRDFFHISSTEPLKLMRIFSATGALLSTIDASGTHATVSVQTVCSGLYFVQILTQAGSTKTMRLSVVK
jgi:Secretion system C-terminal sorting domain